MLDGERREVDLLDRHPIHSLASEQRVVAAAREHPVATATFHVGSWPGRGGGTAGGRRWPRPGGVRAGRRLGGRASDPGGHRGRLASVGRLQTGFVSPEPAGLGGVGRPAEIAPGAYGAIALPTPAETGTEADAVALEVAGYLRDGLPEGAVYRRFTVRTADVPLRG